jgi:hypothetical protein
MKDEDKMKEQLIAELAGSRRRVAKLEDYQQPLKAGEILVKMGYATNQQVQEALKTQEELSRLGQMQKLLTIMMESGSITEEQLQSVLAIQSASSWRRFRVLSNQE